MLVYQSLSQLTTRNGTKLISLFTPNIVLHKQSWKPHEFVLRVRLFALPQLANSDGWEGDKCILTCSAVEEYLNFLSHSFISPALLPSIFFSITVMLYLLLLDKTGGLPRDFWDEVRSSKTYSHALTHLHILTGRVHDMALYIYTKTLRVLNLMKTLV